MGRSSCFHSQKLINCPSSCRTVTNNVGFSRCLTLPDAVWFPSLRTLVVAREDVF